MAEAKSASASGSPVCFPREWAEVNNVNALVADGNGNPVYLRALSLNILADGLCAGGAESNLHVDSSLPTLFAADSRAAGVARLEQSGDTDRKFQFTFRAPEGAVCWSRRWPMLLSMILEHDPDIIGLQEVDLLPGDRGQKTPAHDDEIKRDLAGVGYEGVLVRKYGRACDGVALFWKRSRLRADGSCRGLSLGSVHVALLQPLFLDNCWRVSAVATHLKAGLAPDAESMRAKQAGSLLRQLRGHPNVLLLADLNAHCRPWLDDAGSEVQPQVHPLLASELWSAYETVLGDEPDFTSWGGWADRDVRGVFDYIFFRGDLSALRVLRTPAVGDVISIPDRMPNADHPTDHVPMVADFLVVGQPSAVAPAAKRQRV